MKSTLKFFQLLSFFACLFLLHLAYADLPVKIEVKSFDNNTFFIFYHQRDQVININASNRAIRAESKMPVSLEILNSGYFYQVASRVNLNANRKTINLTFKKEMIFETIIKGEKLTAAKFRNVKEEKEKEKETVSQPKPSSNVISYSVNKSKGEHILSFDFDAKNVGMAAFFRGKYLWIVFDQPKNFTFANNSIFQDFVQLEQKNATVIRMKIGDYKHARAVKSGSKWQLAVSKVPVAGEKKSLAIQKLGDKDGIIINSNFSNNSLVEFKDAEIGDIIKVIPIKTAGWCVAEAVEFVDFNVVPSIQGVAVSIIGEQVEVSKNKDYLQLVSQNFLPSNQEEETVPLPWMHTEGQGSLLPILDKKLDIIDFNYTKARLISEASAAENNQQLFDKRLELAKFLFMHGWYKEALAVLELCKKTTPKQYSGDLHAQFLMAVTHSINGDAEVAKEIYGELSNVIDTTKSTEVVVWKNYNDFLIGYSLPSLGILNNLNSYVNSYPDNLYWPIALAEIELNLKANEIKAAEMMLKEVRTPTGKFANSLKFYKAVYYRKKGQLNLAKQFLEELVKQEKDPFNMVRAEMELVKIQFGSKEIELKEGVKRLEALKLTWRGDKLEYDLLMTLASLYRDGGDNINAFRTYKYTQGIFNNKISNLYINAEMAKIFNDLFLNKQTVDKMDDFTAVALFYEWRESNPIGSHGDEVILSIVKRLMHLDLLDKAAELLQHQVEYRLEGESRVTNADYLAIILLMDKKPEQALKILDKTERDNFKFEEHQNRIRLRVRALIDLKKYDQALDYLKNDDSIDAMILKKECLFQLGKWDEYDSLVAADVEKISDSSNIGEGQKQDILRLAISYYQRSNQLALEKLAQVIGGGDAQLRDTIDLLLTSNKPVDYKNLDQSLNINQMKNLLEKYRQQISN